METFEEQLDQLLDNYYNARHITKDDERSLAAGVLEMAKAQEAIVQAHQLAIDKAETEARIDELKSHIEWNSPGAGSISMTAQEVDARIKELTNGDN